MSAMSVDLVFSIVSGVVKLGGKIDKVKSEAEANESPIVLPSLYREGFGAADYREVLTDLSIKELDGSSPEEQELLKSIRALYQQNDNNPSWQQIKDFINADEDVADLIEAYKLDSVSRSDNDLLVAEVKKLANKNDFDTSDSDISRAIFFISAGESRQARSEWRIAMAVVDVLAEFTLENQHKFIEDEKSSELLKSFLERFSKGDLEDEISGPKVLLKKTLSASLNTLVDNKDALQSNKKWVNSALDALSDARSRVDEDKQDDYLLGLVSGQGYQILVAELIEQSVEYLDDGDRVTYRDVLQDMLQKTAEVYGDAGASYGVRKFVNEHWTDIARAGLRSFSVHGEQLIGEGQDSILQVSLIAAAGSLGNTEGTFSNDSLVVATEAVIAAVASNPEIMDGDSAWAETFFASFAEVVNNPDAGLKKAFSKEGLEAMLRETLISVSEQPALISSQPTFARDVMASILGQLAAVPNTHSESIASAALSGALSALANRPEIIAEDNLAYAETLGAFATRLAGLVSMHQISGIQAEHLTALAAQTIADVAVQLRTGSEETPDWFEALFLSFSDTVENAGVTGALSSEGLTSMLQNLLETLSANPDMVIDSGENAEQFFSNIIGKVAQLDSFNGDKIASAALEGALDTLALNPQLISGHYSEVVGDFAAAMAQEVKNGRLDSIKAETLVTLAAQTLAANPSFLVERQASLTRSIIKRILSSVESDTSGILAGAGLVQISASILSILAARGKLLNADSDSTTELVDIIGRVLDRALSEAADQLGARVDLPSAADAVQALMEAWSRGEISEDMFEEEAFTNLFAEIADLAQKSQELSHLSVAAG